MFVSQSAVLCVHYGCPRVCCTASVASLSPLVIRVRCVRRTQEGEGCGGLPFWVRSWPFTSSNCRDRRSRSSATYTHSESMTCCAVGTRRLLSTVSWEGTQSLNVFALICSLLSVSRLDACWGFVLFEGWISCLLLNPDAHYKSYIILSLLKLFNVKSKVSKRLTRLKGCGA